MTRTSSLPRPREEPFEPCVKCVSGWVSLNEERRRQREIYKGDAVARCACWIAHQEKLARSRAHQVRKG